MNPGDLQMTENDTRRNVIQRELAWHEQESQRRYPVDGLLYDPPAFDSVVQSSLEFLQLRPGELVLDVGCGEGKETLELARRGLRVVSADLSHTQLCRARRRIQEHCPQAQVYFVQANAEESPFASHSFHTIYGKAILHHLNLEIAAEEVDRLLTPGGRATFAEPMDHHPGLRLARWLTPQLRTQDESPLRFGELRRFAGLFQHRQIEVAFLTAPVTYLFRLIPGGEPIFRWFHALLQRVDAWIFNHLPRLKRFAWYGLVHVQRGTRGDAIGSGIQGHEDGFGGNSSGAETE